MNKKTKKIIMYSLNILIYLSLFKVAFGADYTLLESLPGITTVKTGGFGLYLAKIFKLSINVAAVLAIAQLSFAGFKYLTEESFTGQSDAKKRIQNALIGLVVILAAYLVLQTINPELVGTNAGIPPAITNSDYVTSGDTKTNGDDSLTNILSGQDAQYKGVNKNRKYYHKNP